MPEPPVTGQQLVAVKARRDQTISALCEHFANDRLTVEEFERRLDVATRALTLPELESLLSDMPTTVEPTATAPLTMTPAPAAHLRQQQTLVAVMGGVERRGPWQPAEKTMIIAIMGGAVLDFREVQLPPGETKVEVAVVMGGVEIIVPPEMTIDVGGFAFMGGFSHADHRPPGTVATGPVLKIDGFALMGGVDVQVRRPGESQSDARSRKREERRRLRDEWRRR